MGSAMARRYAYGAGPRVEGAGPKSCGNGIRTGESGAGAVAFSRNARPPKIVPTGLRLRSGKMTFDRMAVLSKMMDQGVIPVFYHPDAEICKKVIQACANGGAKCIEFTNRGDFAAHVFLDVTRHFATADPTVIMGVGSVVDAPTAGIYIANGAKFVVGPLLNADVAKVCNRRKIPYSPGCGSASEIGYAEELGCEIVKVFPGSSVGGPDFVRSVLGPCPWTRIMPTGGVDCTEESLSKWFNAGVVCVGMGSNLITKQLLDAEDYAGVEKRVRETVALIRTIRGKEPSGP
jgi:2-dehydro-3-deoxyphosphogluconate aldolase/(4S)-4-hydroxy-2-oxoglutarate aldolase